MYYGLTEAVKADPETYVTHFAWDEAKFPVKSSTRDLAESINEVRHPHQLFMFFTFESKYNAWTKNLEPKLVTTRLCHIKSVATNAQKRKCLSKQALALTLLRGNLMTRDLLEIVSPGDLINTEYLTTLLVVVPK